MAKKSINPEKVLADKLRNFAKRYLKSKLNKFGDDGKMAKMFKGDYKDMCAIATLISNRKFYKAYDKLSHLDTDVEEAIPLYIHNFLYKKGEYSFARTIVRLK